MTVAELMNYVSRYNELLAKVNLARYEYQRARSNNLDSDILLEKFNEAMDNLHQYAQQRIL